MKTYLTVWLSPTFIHTLSLSLFVRMRPSTWSHSVLQQLTGSGFTDCLIPVQGEQKITGLIVIAHNWYISHTFLTLRRLTSAKNLERNTPTFYAVKTCTVLSQSLVSYWVVRFDSNKDNFQWLNIEVWINNLTAGTRCIWHRSASRSFGVRILNQL